MTSDGPLAAKEIQHVAAVSAEVAEHETLKYHLLGPSLTKAGQDSVDQQKVEYSVFFELRRMKLMAAARSQKSSTMPRKARSTSTMRKSRTRTLHRKSIVFYPVRGNLSG